METVSYEYIKDLVKTDKFSATDGSGEQREVFPAHAKAIKNEMMSGNFTPTPIAVGVREKERAEKISIEDNKATIEVNDKDTLPLLDAGHRFYALELLLSDDKVKDQVLKLPITTTFYLDGDTKQDFLNLQLGRTVDRAHMMSLKTQTGLFKKKDVPLFKTAMEVALLLATNTESPFYNQIRFDSRGASGIPINTLCSKGASDLGTSLVGTAKLIIKYNKDAEWASRIIVGCFNLLKDKANNLLASSMILCPPPYGTRGAATMLIGVANIMIFRLLSRNTDEPKDLDKEIFIDSAKKKLQTVVNGNFSSQSKRQLLGGFTSEFLGDLNGKEHEMIPVELIECLSTSTFGVSKLAKQKKVKVTKPSKVKPSKQEECDDEADDLDFDDTAPTEDDEEPSFNDFKMDDDEEKAPWEEEEIEG